MVFREEFLTCNVNGESSTQVSTHSHTLKVGGVEGDLEGWNDDDSRLEGGVLSLDPGGNDLVHVSWLGNCSLRRWRNAGHGQRERCRRWCLGLCRPS